MFETFHTRKESATTAYLYEEHVAAEMKRATSDTTTKQKSNVDTSWREFERQVATIHAKSCKGAVVQHNRHVIGKAGRCRQLDVSIEQPAGPYRMLIVVECKRTRRPVEIGEVEAFVTKLKDVSASRGVMVAPAGFDAGAQAAAAEHGIQLLSYREASKTDWTFGVAVTVTRYKLDWLKAYFLTDSGVVSFPLETLVRFDDEDEPVSLLTLTKSLVQMVYSNQPIGDVVAKQS